MDYAFDIAERFGLTTLVKKGDSNDLNLAALGMGGLTKGVSTLEMASAYSVFVNDGKLKSSTCYTKVTNKAGDMILEPQTTESDAVSYTHLQKLIQFFFDFRHLQALLL